MYIHTYIHTCTYIHTYTHTYVTRCSLTELIHSLSPSFFHPTPPHPSPASFIPPDVEDPPTPMELDDEELEWQKWLHDLMNPSGMLLAHDNMPPPPTSSTLCALH